MATKTVTFTVTADTDLKCTEKLQAASDIIKSLPHDDLIYLAGLAKKKPNFVQKAKPYVHLL
ncbi:MAG: hypothetical protein A3F72_19805 [Bacteroidetes bacterium RIFCSPLOWO2_12_FULL_35_15]|nr:MAG: hypothetical protein A3F72_19805 [Bacteroidetes bacterium RIFCSPLOWO2_12_FULL_35_15]